MLPWANVHAFADVTSHAAYNAAANVTTISYAGVPSRSTAWRWASSRRVTSSSPERLSHEVKPPAWLT
jgi:hypothetical protein